MAIFTLQTPTYDAPSDVTKYGQAGGTPSHRFFYNTPGETLTLDPGFDSQSNRGYGGYTPVGTLDTPSGTEMLLGAGASYLANDAGINAGRHAYDTLAQTGVQPTFLDSIGPGIQKTVDNVGNFATSVSDSLKNTFVGPSGAPPNTGFSNAQFVQPVRYPTAGGSISGNLLTPPVPQGTGISLADPVLGPMGDYTSAINSLSDVSIASPTFGGESLAAPAAQTGNLVTGGGTSASLAAAPGTPIWSGGDFATNFQFGGMQAGMFGGAASLGLGLLMGQDFKTAAKGAAVSGIGTAVGYAIGGPIGGFLGGTLSSVFCFVGGTPIEMADGTTKDVEKLELGDVLFLGGALVGRGECFCEDIYEYKGTFVSASHAVFEDGLWVRVKDSSLATPVSSDLPVIVYPLITETGLIASSGFVSADVKEVPNSENLTEDERLAVLNAFHERNEELFDIVIPNRDIQSQGALRSSDGMGR